MWKGLSRTEILSMIAHAASVVALCLATTAFLMYPVFGQLMTR